MLRSLFFCLALAGILVALREPAVAATAVNWQFRYDWPGDPYLVTNEAGAVSLVLNPILFGANFDYQTKVTRLSSSVADMTYGNSKELPRTAQSKNYPETPAADSQQIGTLANNAAASSPNQTESENFRLAFFLQRWLLFTAVTLFLIRRVWRYFCEAEEDDDFSDHLSSLAVAHRWVFPVYMALLATVAVAEFFQFGNVFFSLSVLLLASSVRGYYCEGDFAEFPKSKKIHLALSLALIWLGWTQGFDNYLSDFSAWHHGHIRAWMMLVVLTQIYRGTVNSPDLAEQQGMLKALMWSFLAAFIVGGIVGGIVGCVVWIYTGFSGSLWLWFFAVGLFACFLFAVSLFATKNPVLMQAVGGTILDAVMPRFFGRKTLKKRRLPEILLLRHWREHGEVEKAWQTAQDHLLKEARALSVWLFAMETSILYRRKPDDALKILKTLCATEEFHYDHRTVAVAQVQGWLAAAGFGFDATQFKIERSPLAPSALTDKVNEKCRAGRFGEAATLLLEVLEKDSLNEAAFTQLVRLYCQDLKNRPAAEKLIDEAGDTFGPKLLEFLKNSLAEWMQAPIRSQAKPRTLLDRLLRRQMPETTSHKLALQSLPAPVPPKSQDPLDVHLERLKQAQAQHRPDTSATHDPVEKMLLERRLGSAVELLQQQAEAAPANFELWLRYAEAHGHHCGQVATAEKIIKRMERSGHFKKAQLKKAHTQLRKWHKKHPLRQAGW